MVCINSSKLLKNILWLQWIGSFGAFLMTFTSGLTMGWTSPYTARLTAIDSELPITIDEASWVASFLNFGRFLGGFIGGICVRYIGSKRTIIVIGIPLILGWICLIAANSVYWLYVARICAGTSIGISFTSFPLYLGEMSSPKIRGSLVSLAMSGFAFGTVVGNTMGVYMSLSLFSYISLIPNIIFIILFIWIPESPYYLIQIGKIEEAEKSIIRYNPNANSKIEIEHLKDFFQNSNSLLSLKDQLKELNLPSNRRAFIILIFLFFAMQFSGINSYVLFMETILTRAKLTVILPATCVIMVGVIGIMAGWIAIYIADKFRRKVLMISSSIGVAISMIGLGTHFTLLEYGFDPLTLQWLPIVSTIVFMLFICNGLIPVPNMLLSELFASNIKSMAACFVSIIIGAFAFTSTKSYQPLVNNFGLAFIFFMHAVLMILSAIFAAIFMPETKGKTLKEIQDQLIIRK